MGRSRETLHQAALRYLAGKDRTEAQMRSFLQRAGAAPNQVETVLRQLHSQGYLDDARFARRWAEARLQRRPMGRLRLQAELQAQGFHPTLIAAILTELYSRYSERGLAETLLRTKKSRIATTAQCSRRLRSHGFSEEIIEAVLEEQT
jgi:regulatory protein